MISSSGAPSCGDVTEPVTIALMVLVSCDSAMARPGFRGLGYKVKEVTLNNIKIKCNYNRIILD